MPLLLQSETESLMKVKTETLKEELSELMSQMMMKENEIQRLQKENNLVKKHLDKSKENEEKEVKFSLNLFYVCTVIWVTFVVKNFRKLSLYDKCS